MKWVSQFSIINPKINTHTYIYISANFKWINFGVGPCGFEAHEDGSSDDHQSCHGRCHWMLGKNVNGEKPWENSWGYCI